MDFEKCKKKFQRYCYNSLTHKEFVSDRVLTTEGDLKAADFMYQFPMPKFTPECYRLTVFKIFDADNFDPSQFSRWLTLILEHRMHKDTIVAGETIIFDLEQFKPHHYAKIITPVFLKCVKFGLVNYPFMIKHILIINCHPLLEKGVPAVKAILPQKIADRFTILNNPKDLEKYVPRECLPEDYGGAQKSLVHFHRLWKQYLVELNDFYEELDRSKPTGPIPEEFKAYENEFGVDGSFRKLNID